MSPSKEIAMDFLNKIIAGQIREAYSQHASPKFKHHNAYFKGDADSLRKGMEDNHEHFPEKIFTINQAISEGQMVAIHSLLKFNPEHTGVAVVHIFRFDGDKIAELWDIAQILPDDSPNENGPL